MPPSHEHETMKGVVFTEFLEMVESRFSAEVVSDIVEKSELPSGGTYAAVGTYDYREMITLVGQLARRIDAPVAELLHAFGRHMLARFVASYPQFFVDKRSSFEIFSRVDDLIHVEVRKLYPDAELPSFVTHQDGDTLTMMYRSPRCMADLADGLIAGTAEHYGERLQVTRRDMSGDGRQVEFTILRVDSALAQ